ncbi:outer membrane beta-barrel protein [Emticicia sp. BO119]|uniref:outer membrane beta-barrel protein n=1 Tax=Emticicia sp. BO119 TaxID=2757768 RepID=UPI0015F109FC|nr:outer membrane beta-barrel protein [Emticicia sp. BO119]MBA4852954.1 outer membrane beta-barrel protein [Emticicia sp. BO119]
MSKLLFATVLFFLAYSVAFSQINISGKVIDYVSKQGVPFVNVSLLASKDSVLVKGSITDSSGIFQLSSVPKGSFILFFSSIEHQKYYQAFSVENGTLSALQLNDIVLTPTSQVLNEVNVKADKIQIQQTDEKLIVNIADNKLFTTATNGFDILKKMPGVQINNDGSLSMAGGVIPAIFIDGKPMPMSVEQLQNYLNSLTPEMIASIEIIANPSGRYDAEYKAIIDIKLQRDKTLGWIGNYVGTLQQGVYTLNNNNLTLTYNTPKVAYTARLGYQTGATVYRYRALQHQANTNIMRTDTWQKTNNTNLNLQFEADYHIKKNHNLGLILRTNQVNRKAWADNTLHFTNSTGEYVLSNLHSMNNYIPSQRNYGINLSYDTRISKNDLHILGIFSQINNRRKEDIQNTQTLTGDLFNYWKTNLLNDISIRSIQSDFVSNIGKGKLEIGAKFAAISTKNHLRYDTLAKDNIFVPDPSRTNNFHYDEYISATYLIYGQKWSKLDYKIGMRAENTHSFANAITSNQITERNYLKWLPSINLSYQLANEQKMTVAYTHRMTRPGFEALNPFKFYLSPLNYWIGNPYLLPSVTKQLSLTYTKKNFYILLNAGREVDPMTRYPEYNRATNVLEYLGKNLPYNDFATLEANWSIVVKKWWRMNHNLGLYYKKEQMPYHGVVYQIPIKNYMINGSQVFTLAKDLTFDIYYLYVSSRGNSLYIMKPVYYIDLGLQKTWLKGKLNTKFTFYDITNTYYFRLVFREKSIINNEFSHWYGNQRLVFSLTYNFGKSGYKLRQNTRNEEESRVSN